MWRNILKKNGCVVKLSDPETVYIDSKRKRFRICTEVLAHSKKAVKKNCESDEILKLSRKSAEQIDCEGVVFSDWIVVRNARRDY